MSDRNYLQEEEAAFRAAKKAYRVALEELQSNCEHKVILEHETSDYEVFRVCEGCGTTCRAKWGSFVHAIGNLNIFEGRAYKVTWGGFVDATPATGVGWAQSRHNPVKFRRGRRRREND